jgi:hypothetical protein
LDPNLTTKNYWKLIKTVMGNKQITGIPTMMENDIPIPNDTDKARLLNDYFIKQTILPDTNIDLPPFEYNTDARLGHITCTPLIVKQLLLKLDTSTATGQDQINNRILKECASALCVPLSALFNKSLDLGIFPSSWKEAMVTAIFKKQDRQLKENYRPISLLSCISKIFERIIYNKLYSHLKTNKLLDVNNSGFQENDSSILRLLSLTDTIFQSLDNQDEVLLVFLDISKAFDRVWHEGILYKLKQAGIHGILLQWFESYLSNRKQRVVVGGKSSESKYVHAGVPQGSILGPLLFLLYVSDLSSNLQNKSSLFADDTTIIVPIDNDPVSCIQNLNLDLNRLQIWADLWRITFNPSKTTYVRVSYKFRKRILNPIYLQRIKINEVDSHTNLGLIYSTRMDWSHHLQNIAKKVGLRMANLKRLQYCLPRSALTKIYTTMIRPIIEYGEVIYDNLTLSRSNQLELIQRRAALICTGAYKHTEHLILLKELGWEPLADRRKQHRLTAYYKLLKGHAPEHIKPLLPQTVASQTTYNLRNKEKLRPRFTRLKSSQNSFFPKTAKDWNNLSHEIKNLSSITKFKRAISKPLYINPYYKLHQGRGGVWLSRIRMGLSGLNGHRFTYNFIPSPTCLLCNQAPENALHYLWDCPNHALMRIVMVDRCRAELDIHMDRENVLNICLYGDILDKEKLKTLLNITIEFIKTTARFK